MNNGLFFDQEIAADRILIQKPLAWAFLSNTPIVPGHTLIVPTRVVSRIDELTVDEHKEIFNVLRVIQASLREVFGTTGFNIAWNEGIEAGQSVRHFHMHVIPRKRGDIGITKYEPRKFLYRPGSRENRPESELQAIASVIRTALNK